MGLQMLPFVGSRGPSLEKPTWWSDKVGFALKNGSGFCEKNGLDWLEWLLYKIF